MIKVLVTGLRVAPKAKFVVVHLELSYKKTNAKCEKDVPKARGGALKRCKSGKKRQGESRDVAIFAPTLSKLGLYQPDISAG